MFFTIIIPFLQKAILINNSFSGKVENSIKNDIKVKIKKKDLKIKWNND
jgi:hypothetical protein